MNDSRERFEKWWDATDFTNSGPWAPDTPIQWAFDAWQAAEAETARRCAELAGDVAMEYRAKYKGVTVDGIRRGGSYDPHDDGMSDGAATVEDAIRTEFSEAFK